MSPVSEKTPSLFQKNARIARLLPLAIIFIGICFLTGLFFTITQRMNILREAPGDNLTWTLSQVEVDVLTLLDEVHLMRQDGAIDVSNIRRRFNNLYSRASTLGDARVFAPMRQNDTFSSQLVMLEKCLAKMATIIDSPDAGLVNSLDALINELQRVRDDAHAIALTGISLRSEASDAERAALARLLLVAAVVSLAMILFLVFVLYSILRQHRLHKDVSDAVTRANLRLAASFDVSLDAIVVASDQGVILEFNEAAEKVFGYTAEEAVGACMSELIIPHQHRAAHLAGMERFNRTKKPNLVGQGRIEITALRKSGEEFPVEISIGLAEGYKGTIFISYLRDITKRQAAQEALKTARDEALAAEKAKTNFLAVMSHEMRTPLNGIFGTLELLSNSKVTKKQREYLGIAKRSGDILLHHVNDVLDISRMDAEKMELTQDSFDLEQFFKDVVTTNKTTADAQSNTLVLKLRDMPTTSILLDERRLRQVTYNLISNALKFTQNGKVTLSACCRLDMSGKTVLEFSVTDTGIGILPEAQGYVFDRFYTKEQSYDRYASGAGLGLAICKQLVEMMQGTISLQSVAGLGSTFTVVVPMAIDHRAPMETSDMAPATDFSALQGKEVMLVEDNEINRLIVDEMLSQYGMIVHEAHNGQQAVDLSKKRKFAAILMDISMPVMNGVDATRHIRSAEGPNQQTSILGFTAHALAEEKARFLDAGMDGCINKPVSQTDLFTALLAAVGLRDVPHFTKNNEIIIVDTFDQLSEMLAPDRLKKLINDFDREISNLLTKIPSLLEHADMPTLAATTHRSIGSSGMIGAMVFQAELRALEQAAKSNDVETARHHARAAAGAWPATISALRAKIV
jgi:PAS domain S-box-containing protein